jgi:AGZA family xanthine/uracil permease-like MFS transporter
VSLVVLLLALFGGVRMPLGLPGAFAAVAAGALIYWGRALLGGGEHVAVAGARLGLAIPWPTLAWIDVLPTTLPYLGIALPFAFLTVVGGIDNTESAAAAGDEYDTRGILMTEGFCTFVAGLCGGVVESTPYIGHPAFKKMGAGAGYTVATALFVGLGGMLGYLPFLVGWIPAAAVAPILVYIGLEVVAQGYLATPARHGPAISLAILPSLAFLVSLQAGSLLAAAGGSPANLTGEVGETFRAIRLLGNGFIVTALLWGAAGAELIDGRFRRGALYFLAAGVLCLFGVIHSPMAQGTLFLPWRVADKTPFVLAAAYSCMAGIVLLASMLPPKDGGRAAGH